MKDNALCLALTIAFFVILNVGSHLRAQSADGGAMTSSTEEVYSRNSMNVSPTTTSVPTHDTLILVLPLALGGLILGIVGASIIAWGDRKTNRIAAALCFSSAIGLSAALAILFANG